MMESLNSFEFHWKGTTPARCTRADKYLNETLLHASRTRPERPSTTSRCPWASRCWNLNPPRPAPPPNQLPVPNLAALFTGPVLL